MGAHARLLALLQQPCVTFAEVADRYGVTRECVRQWYARLLPLGPSGQRHLIALKRARASEAPSSATFVDADGATYQQFKNTFGALWRWSRE